MQYCHESTHILFTATLIFKVKLPYLLFGRNVCGKDIYSKDTYDENTRQGIRNPKPLNSHLMFWW